MSGASYRLEAPRPRPPPRPLYLKDSSYKSSPITSSYQDSQTLLYDLPSTTSMSPPPSSPRSQSRVTSPTSPTFPGRSRTPRNGRPTPPPSGRNRSTTPMGFSQSELETFSGYCRAWYFDQDEEAGRLMTQILSNLPPSHRAPFSRLQASIRSAYHRSVNARKTAEFQAHLSATTPGGSLMPHARADPLGAAARKERYDRFDQFVRSWCTMGMPGTKPFFEALWAIMRLQVVPENLGGSGCNRVDWELDDAVFKEAAGKDFMLEAIDILKGVLGFEEVQSSKPFSPSNSSELYPSIPIHARSRSQPLTSHAGPTPTAAPNIQPKRARAPSDPFLDTPALSQSIPSSSSRSSGNTAVLLSALNSDSVEEPPSPTFPDGSDNHPSWRDDLLDHDAGEESLRIWTSPDLSNPEFLNLLKVFPPFITRRILPRFPVNAQSRHQDVEEGDDEVGNRQVRCGTGIIRISHKPRSDGWEGGLWTRFVMWLRRTFC